MKLKDFMESSHFKLADIIEYYNRSNKEVVFNTEIQRRRLLNKSVIAFSKRKEGNLKILRVILESEVKL